MNTQPNALQARALAIIAGGGVRQAAAVDHPVRIVSPDGIVSPLTVDELLREKWVTVDTSRTLHEGQPVEITACGLALLPDQDQDALAAGDGPTGDQVLASALRVAIRYGDVGVVLWDDEVELTGPDDTVLVSIKGRRFEPYELAGFLGINADDIDDAR